jgi:hypothetical protein
MFALGSVDSLARRLGLVRTRRRDPARAAAAREFLTGIGFSFDTAGDDAPAPEPLFGGDHEAAADKERADNKLRETDRTSRRRKIAHRLLTIIRPADVQKIPTDEQLASEVKDYRQEGESWPDFVALVRESAREAGLFDLSGPNARGGAGVAGSEGNVNMALAQNGGSLSDSEAAGAADIITRGNYSRSLEHDEWEGKLRHALDICPQGASAYGECRSTLESVRQSRRFNRDLSADDKKLYAGAILHAEQAADFAANNRPFIPPSRDAVRTERIRNLR